MRYDTYLVLTFSYLLVIKVMRVANNFTRDVRMMDDLSSKDYVKNK